MIMSNKKYADPSPVLKEIVDDTGNPIQIGGEEDVGEFNIKFQE